MLARVGFSVDALTELDSTPGVRAGLLRQQHEDLVSALRAHGSLVFSSSADKADFEDWVRELGATSQHLQRLWTRVFRDLLNTRRVVPLEPEAGVLSTALSAEDLVAWKGRLEVAVVESDQAELLGMSVDDYSHVDQRSGVNVVLPQSLRHCAVMKTFQDLAADGTLAAGSSREDFFKQTLAAPARDASRIVVLDRYIFRDLWKTRGNERRALTWLLEKFNQLPPTHYREVVLMGEVQADGFYDHRTRQSRGPADMEEAAARVRETWRPGNGSGIKKVVVVGAEWPPESRQESRLPHDRHIHLNTGMGIGIPAGLDRFSRSSIDPEEGVSWQFVTAPAAMEKLRKSEQLVRAKAGREVVAYQRPAG